jgi:hypothetical protein
VARAGTRCGAGLTWSGSTDHLAGPWRRLGALSSGGEASPLLIARAPILTASARCARLLPGAEEAEEGPALSRRAFFD